jgi:hypothetical protein
MQGVDPTVNRDRLSAQPRILQDRGVGDISHLLDDVQLTKTIGAIRRRVDDGPMLLIGVAERPQPVVDESESCALKGGPHAAASVVAAHDHVANVQHVYRVLQDGQAVQIRVHDEIRDVPVHEQLARRQPDDFIRGNPAVGAADPQVAGCLLGCQSLEEIRIRIKRSRGPRTIVLEKFPKSLHEWMLTRRGDDRARRGPRHDVAEPR